MTACYALYWSGLTLLSQKQPPSNLFRNSSARVLSGAGFLLHHSPLVANTPNHPKTDQPQRTRRVCRRSVAGAPLPNPANVGVLCVVGTRRRRRDGELVSVLHSGTCYNALMASIQVEAWKCDLCGHIWIKQPGVIPKQCAKCRTRVWNCDSESPKAEKMIIARDPKPRAREIEKPAVREVEADPQPAIPLAASYSRPAHAATCKCGMCLVGRR